MTLCTLCAAAAFAVAPGDFTDGLPCAGDGVEYDAVDLVHWVVALYSVLSATGEGNALHSAGAAARCCPPDGGMPHRDGVGTPLPDASGAQRRLGRRLCCICKQILTVLQSTAGRGMWQSLGSGIFRLCRQMRCSAKNRFFAMHAWVFAIYFDFFAMAWQ